MTNPISRRAVTPNHGLGAATSMDSTRLLAWVEPSIVAEFVPPRFDAACARATLDAAGRSADDHARFLDRWNGCYAFGGALHVLGARPEPPNQSLDAWNRPDGWREAFGLLVEPCWFFAESAFGDQFGYRDGKVVRLRALEARVEPMASSFSQWLEAVFLDPQRWLSLDVFDAAVRRLGPLPFGGHFGPPPAWTQGSALRADQLDVLPARDNLELRGAASIFATSNTRPAFGRIR
jgi:hypothetical protein